MAEDAISWLKLNAISILMTAIIGTLAYFAMEFHTVTTNYATKFAIIENDDAALRQAFEAYKNEHYEFADGQVKLVVQRIDFLDQKVNDKAELCLDKIKHSRLDPFTGTEGRNLRTLVDERYFVVNRRFAELEQHCKDHDTLHRNLEEWRKP